MMITQNSNSFYVLMEFLLYSNFTITAFYFLSQIPSKASNPNLIVKISKILLCTIFGFLLGILLYFLIKIVLGHYNYHDCEDPAWVANRISAFTLSLIYFGIGLKSSIELKKLQKQTNKIIEKQAEKELW